MSDIPEFVVAVEPALTLADTRFSVRSPADPPRGPKPTGGEIYAALLKWAEKSGLPDIPYPGPGYSEYAPAPVLAVIDGEGAARVALKPTAIGHRLVINEDSDIPQHASSDFSATITTEASIGWETSVTAGVQFTVGVEAGGGPVKATASTTYSLSATVGRSTSASRSEAVGTTDGYAAEVPPGENALIIGYLSLGSLQFDVDVGWAYSGQLSFDRATAKAWGRKSVALADLPLPRRQRTATVTLPIATEV